MRLFRSKCLALLAVLLTLSIGAPSFAAGPIVQDSVTVASGTIAAGGLKVSATGTNDFIDFTASVYRPAAEGANPLPLHVGQLLVVTDSAKKKIYVWLGAAGTGETVGVELHTSANAASDPNANEANATTGWSNRNSGTIASVSTLPSTGSYHFLVTSPAGLNGEGGKATLATEAGKLYKTTRDISVNITGNSEWRSSMRNSADTATIADFAILSGAAGYQSLTNYYTASGANETYVFRTVSGAVASTAYLDNLSFKAVTSPSTAGVWAAQSKGSATKTITAKDAAFNYNDASGYTYEILKSTAAPVIQSYDIPAGNLLMDSTTANAFIAPLAVGGAVIDLSYAQVGGYDVAIYQSGALVAWARAKAEAPGGEALSGSELITGWDNHVGLEFETLTVSGGNITQAVNSAGQALAESPSIGGITYAAGLYKYAGSLTLASGAAPFVYANRPAGTSVTGNKTLSAGANTVYFTIPTSGAGDFDVRCGSNTDFALTNSLQRVTECAATGLHLTSGDGVTRGFIYLGPINQNAAATVKVIYRGAQ